MFTILGGDGKEYGPVTTEQIRAWIAAGRANLETQAKLAGTAEWRRLGDFETFGGALASPPALATAATATATAGAAPLTGTAKEIADRLIADAAPLDVFNCVGRSFELWKANFLPLVGVTLLIVLVQMAAGMVPFLGILSSLCLNGVFYGGLYYYYLGKMRGQPREIGDAFAGFSKAFVPLLLATMLTSALILVLLVPFLGPWFFVMVKGIVQSGGTAPPSLPGPGLLALFVVGGFVILYFTVAWTFTFALVIDRGLGPWTAMEVSRRVVTRQWFRVFAALLLGGILTLLGLIGLFIGVFFTLPLVIGTVLYAYEDLCHPRGVKSAPTDV